MRARIASAGIRAPRTAPCPQPGRSPLARSHFVHYVSVTSIGRSSVWLLRSWLLLVLLSMPLVPSSTASANTADIVGAATVRDDGSLRIGNRLIRMYGIYIAP